MGTPHKVGEAAVKAEYLLPPTTTRLSREPPLVKDIDDGDSVNIVNNPQKVNDGEQQIDINIPSKDLDSGDICITKASEEPDGIQTKNCNSDVVDDENRQQSHQISEKAETIEGKHTLETKVLSSDIQPPFKKQKGQNKARPRTVPKQKEKERICPTLLVNQECRFGEECKFNHNVEEYIKIKGPDLGDECVNFSRSGRCRYGIVCMFSKAHTTDDYKNIIDAEKYEKFCEEENNYNTLKNEVMIKVRKRQYKLPRSEKYLATMNKQKNKDKINNEDMRNSMNEGSNRDLHPREKKNIDFSGKLYLAPLTTVGNLPFRKICKKLGADITCGEMALSTKLLQCHQAEWALMRRDPSEDIFGVQICGAYPDTMTRVTELLNRECKIDFIDINMGCPIDLIYRKGEGSALMKRLGKLEQIVKGMVEVSDVPITIKMRTGVAEKKVNAHKVVPLLKEWGVDMITLHGRTREQRYTKLADWDYIYECAELCSPVPLFGNGDILSFEEANMRTETSGIMIARGALIKPWIFTEIKEQRHWDISSGERFDFLRDFTNAGLYHWGSDFKGVENTRRFLLEWLSFLHRYIPVGLLEVVPQKINERAPKYMGRNDLETLFISENAADWVKISEMLLGPVPDNFTFLPKHKANAYS